MTRSAALRVALSVAIAAVGIAATGAAAATRSTAGEGRPSTDEPLRRAAVTRAPEPERGLAVALAPVAAVLLPSPIDDAVEEQVRVRFGAFVAVVGSPSRFRVVTRDGRSDVTAIGARSASGSPDEVDVLFGAGTDLTQVALLIVEADAVRDEADRGSVPAVLPLAGAEPGDLPGPELVVAVADVTLDQVRFTFDRELGDAEPEARDFHVVTSDGHVAIGTSVVAAHRRAVVVAFDQDLTDVTRLVAGSGAVVDRFGQGSVLTAIGGATAAPDLAAAATTGVTSVDLTFDEAVAVGDISKINVVLDDGRLAPATAVARPSPTVVRVSFRALQDQPEALAAVSVDRGAVLSLAGPATQGTAAMLSLGPPAVSGRTAQPDPVSVRLDADTGWLRVAFDETIDEHALDPSRAQLLTQDGRLVAVTAAVEVDGGELILAAPPSVARRAAGLVLGVGAVSDPSGNPSTPALLRL